MNQKPEVLILIWEHLRNKTVVERVKTIAETEINAETADHKKKTVVENNVVVVMLSHYLKHVQDTVILMVLFPKTDYMLALILSRHH
ncbi:MAG: hypothetical protein CMH50_02985 [Myxococcales bacterium]|nr:hypothetical protein [Myxococcales bacterium]